jgi:hypothetical protein
MGPLSPQHILRLGRLGRWCHIIDDVKDSFYEELECVFDKFPNYHMKILSGDFNAKVGREDIFKLTNGNVSVNSMV